MRDTERPMQEGSPQTLALCYVRLEGTTRNSLFVHLLFFVHPYFSVHSYLPVHPYFSVPLYVFRSPLQFSVHPFTLFSPFTLDGTACKHFSVDTYFSVHPRRYHLQTSFFPFILNFRPYLKVKVKYFLRYLEQQTDDSPLYVFDSHFDDHEVAKGLLEDFHVPSYFPDDLFSLVGERRRPPYR